jgi:hypothetical protein
MIDPAQLPNSSAVTTPPSAATAAREKLFARLKTTFADAQRTQMLPSPTSSSPTPAPELIAMSLPGAAPQPVNAPEPATAPQPVASSSVLDQVVPTVVAQSDPLNPPNAQGNLTKERSQVFTLEHPAVDYPGGVQSVEQLRNPEIPPEVESYLQKIENHQEQLPQEVVIADQSVVAPNNHYLAQPVVVLPITQAVEKAGQRKGPKFSVRWLVEWSWKMMKVFKGKIIYRQVEA